MWYNINNILMAEENRKVEPVKNIKLNLKEFDIILRENQKKDFFDGKKFIKVLPNNMEGGNAKIINLLAEKGEIEIFAELKSEKICISVKMKDGTLYSDIIEYNDLAMFQKYFRKK